MFQISKPTDGEIDKFLEKAAVSEFSYRFIGETRDRFHQSRKRLDSMSFNVDWNRKIIGQGDGDWERAKQAIRDWKMFDTGWCSICWPDTPIEEGRTVAMMASHLGIWSLNAARIVYTIDKQNQFGFAYGTLRDHAECGEERFLVERDPDTLEVWYELYSFSRPKHLLAQIGYPYARYLQRYFVRDSQLAMIAATGG